MKKPFLLIVLAALAAAAFAQNYAGFKQAGNAVNTSADMDLTAGHPILPIGTKVLVTRPDNGKQVTVTINKRIPNTSSYMLQISRGTAAALDIPPSGMALVQLEVPKPPPVVKKPEPVKEEKKPEEKKPEPAKEPEKKPEEKKPEEKAPEPEKKPDEKPPEAAKPPEEPKAPDAAKAPEPEKPADAPKAPDPAPAPAASSSPTLSAAPAATSAPSITINNTNTSSSNVNIGELTSGLLASAAKPAPQAKSAAPEPVVQPQPKPAAPAPVVQPQPKPAPAVQTQPKPAPVEPEWEAPEPPAKPVAVPFPLSAAPRRTEQPEPARYEEPPVHRPEPPRRHPEPPPVYAPPAYAPAYSAPSYEHEGRSAVVQPRVPEPYSGLYKVQVGAYRDSANAKRSFDRLTVAGFRPSADQYEGLSRVFLENIAAEDIPGLAASLGRLGFATIYVRK